MGLDWLKTTSIDQPCLFSAEDTESEGHWNSAMYTGPTSVANDGRLELLFRALAHTGDPSKRGVSFGGAAAFCSSRNRNTPCLIVTQKHPILADPGSDLSYVGVSIYLRGHFPSS